MDPITDMFNRIMNAQAAKKAEVLIPFSNFKNEIALILEKNGFVAKVEKKGRKSTKLLEVILKYQKSDSGSLQDLSPAISGIKRISKQGQRLYTSSRDVKKVRGGYGIAVISTPKGLMTDQEARKNKMGGELICEVW